MSETPLVPGISLGPVCLGDSQSEVRRVLGEPRASRDGDSHLFLEYDGQTIVLQDGSVTMLIAEASSTCRTPEGIAVGTPWRHLVQVLDDVQYDEEEGLWSSPSHRGVWYEVVRPAHEYEQPLDPPYVPELYAVTEPAAALVRRLYVMR